MLVVLDANIFVSALITPQGLVRRVVEAGLARRYEYAACPTLFEELERVTRRPNISNLLTLGAADRFLVDVRGGARIEPDPELLPIGRDPLDDYLLALAASVEADHLVTGDHDLLSLKAAPVPITTLREFADLLWQRGEGAAATSLR